MNDAPRTNRLPWLGLALLPGIVLMSCAANTVLWLGGVLMVLSTFGSR